MIRIKIFFVALCVLLSCVGTCSCTLSGTSELTGSNVVTAPKKDTSNLNESVSNDDTTIATESIDTPKNEETTNAITNDISDNTTKNTTGETTNDAVNTSDSKITFLCAGDNIVHEAVFTDAASRAKGSGSEYEFDSMYSDIKSTVSGADVAFVNQEGTIGGADLGISGYPRFNAPEEAGNALIKTGFDIVNLANNHIVDKGLEGFKNTISFFEKKSVMMIGAYKSKSDYENIRVYEKNGIKIAFITFTYSTNGHSLPNSSGYIVPYISETEIKSQIKLAKETGADAIFAVMHWGDEDSFNVTSSQQKYAQLLCDNGVDVIIGMHPHVVQKMEWITGDSGNKTLVMYSLGNLLSTMYYSYNMVGIMVEFDVVRDNENVRIENVRAIPTVTYYTYNPDNKADKYRNNIGVYLLNNFTEQMASAHGSNEKDDKPVTLEKLKKYVTDNISKEFLPNYLK